MQTGIVYYREEFAGVLARFKSGSYEFRYAKKYRENPKMPSISGTLNKREAIHTSPSLFSFFYGLLAEGVQKSHQCRMLRIDERDHFGRLLATSPFGGIGAVRVVPRDGVKR